MFTARYGLIPYIKQITLRLSKVNLVSAPRNEAWEGNWIFVITSGKWREEATLAALLTLTRWGWHRGTWRDRKGTAIWQLGCRRTGFNWILETALSAERSEDWMKECGAFVEWCGQGKLKHIYIYIYIYAFQAYIYMLQLPLLVPKQTLPLVI